jgi:CrcB protein
MSHGHGAAMDEHASAQDPIGPGDPGGAGPTPRRTAGNAQAPLATDPDVDLHVPQQRQELRQHPAVLLGTIAAGGVLGAVGRYGLAVAMPHAPTGFPWSTFLTNVSGAFLIGLLMVLIAEVLPAHPLIRPFLGVGVLGGYTTFSTSIVDTQQLVVAGAARSALLYLFATLACAVLATLAGTLLARTVIRRGGRRA